MRAVIVSAEDFIAGRALEALDVTHNGLDYSEMNRRLDESYEDRQPVSHWRRRWWGLTDDVGFRISRIKCRLFDRHDLYCRGRVDHTTEQGGRTR